MLTDRNMNSHFHGMSRDDFLAYISELPNCLSFHQENCLIGTPFHYNFMMIRFHPFSEHAVLAFHDAHVTRHLSDITFRTAQPFVVMELGFKRKSSLPFP